ncbi:MAG: hypothetical protein WAR79_18350, partial [Melioribacteraceae bacterium]
MIKYFLNSLLLLLVLTGQSFSQFVTLHVEKDINGSGSGQITVNGTAKTLPYTDNFLVGTPIEIIAVPDIGNHFVEWSGDLNSTNSTETFSMFTDRNISVTYEIDELIIGATVNPSGSGSISGLNAGGIYSYNDEVNLTATANTGYTFTKWTENGTQVSTNTNYSFTATVDRNLVANFSQNQYTITATANPSGGGTITGLKVGGIYIHGEQVNLTATANTGYTFTNWTENGTAVSSNANYSFSASTNRNLVANFSQNQYTITATANPSGGGTITGLKVGGIYIHGEQVN